MTETPLLSVLAVYKNGPCHLCSKKKTIPLVYKCRLDDGRIRILCKPHRELLLRLSADVIDHDQADAVPSENGDLINSEL